MSNTKIDTLIKENLNKEQYKAATYLWKKDSIIIAWAWSWKTWTLSYKVMNLISKWIKEEDICVITFTNKAAKEIKHRILKIQQELWTFDSKLTIWTFHSIFFWLLKEIFDRKEEFWLETWYTNEVTIEKNNSIVYWLLCEKEFWTSLQSDKIEKLIRDIKNNWYYTKKEIESYLKKNWWHINIYKIIEKYQKLSEKQNSIDFDDIMFLSLKYALENKQVMKFFKNKFKYICVDEAQDTNTIQFMLLNLFKANITYIWDDFQSIYKFRWAQMNTFLELWTRKDIKIFKLISNYRSLEHIVSMWNTIIKNNEQQFEKEQISHRWWNEENRIQLSSYDNQFQEMKQCLVEIKAFKEKNKDIKWSDFAVLYRVNQQSELLEKYAKELWIPYIVRTNKKSMLEYQIDLFFTILKYSLNQQDTSALMQILNVLYQSNWYDLFFDITNWKTLDHIIKKSEKKWSFVDHLIDFKEKNEKTKKLLQTCSATNLKKIWYIFNFNIQVISKIISYYEICSEWKIISYKEFLDWYLLNDFQYEWYEDAVNFMTVHSAKWLEFFYVHIVWLQDWIFPLQQSIKKKIDIEEERRLFYVAITRAKDILKMSYSLQIIHFWKLHKAKRSRFINEMWSSIHYHDKTFYNAKLEETKDVISFDSLF